MTADERREIVQDFRDSKTRLLLTTDLLARGIDIPAVNLVVNFDLPMSKETYMHRIGRCGRFDKKGVSISFVKMNDPKDVKVFNKMKHFYSLNIKEMPTDLEKYI
jgi:superfamily II DNA/RNA helicase